MLKASEEKRQIVYRKTKIRKMTVFLLEKFRQWSNTVKDVKENVDNRLSRNIEGPGGTGGTILGINIHLPQQRPKGSAQGAQEPGHLPQAVGQTVQVSGGTNQLHLNQVVLKRLFMSAPTGRFCPFPKWSGRWSFLARKTKCLWLWEYNQWRVSRRFPNWRCVHFVWAVESEPHPQRWGQDPKILIFDQLTLDPPKAVEPSWCSQGSRDVQAFFARP